MNWKKPINLKKIAKLLIVNFLTFSSISYVALSCSSALTNDAIKNDKNEELNKTIDNDLNISEPKIIESIDLKNSSNNVEAKASDNVSSKALNNNKKHDLNDQKDVALSNLENSSSNAETKTSNKISADSLNDNEEGYLHDKKEENKKSNKLKNNTTWVEPETIDNSPSQATNRRNNAVRNDTKRITNHSENLALPPHPSSINSELAKTEIDQSKKQHKGERQTTKTDFYNINLETKKNDAPSGFGNEENTSKNEIVNQNSEPKIIYNKLNKEVLEKINRQQIPYNVDFSKYSNLINLSPNTINSRYFIDIKKDNERGEITLRVLKRTLKFGEYEKDILSNTILLDTVKLNGFETFSSKQIASERTLALYGNSTRGNNISSIKSKDYSDLTFDDYKNDNFKKIGTATVLDKVQDKSIYYIATNKHVINSNVLGTIIENWGYNSSSNFFRGKVYSFFDYLIHHQNAKANLKGMISFTQSLNFSPDTKKLDKPPLEIALNQDFIKSIHYVADFSKVQTKAWDEAKYYDQVNINKDYQALKNTRQENKTALDLVILRVEFEKENDPWKSWFLKRPTKMRAINDQDFFNQEAYWDNYYDGRKSNFFAQKQNKRLTKESLSQGSSLETGNYQIINKAITGGYPRFQNQSDFYLSAHKKHQEIGLGWNYNYLYRDDAAFSNVIIGYQNNSEDYYREQGSFVYLTNDGGSYNLNAYGASLTYQKSQMLTSGASGSPLFDKNLNLIGLIYGSSDDYLSSWYGQDTAKNYAIYFQTNLEYDYLDKTPSDSLEDQDFRIKNYNYVNANWDQQQNYLSLFTQIKKLFPEDLKKGTTLFSKAKNLA